MEARDMPKLESPFVRKMIGNDYLVTPEINPDCQWVFDDPTVLATEKLDGTNVSILIEGGNITGVWNRTQRIPFFTKGRSHILQGLLESFDRGYMESLTDGQHYGELIGEKVNSNPCKVSGHLWIPFEAYARQHLSYTSWGKYPKTFEAISNWFEKDLFSIYARRTRQVVEPPEGVVFVQPSTGKMAKLRRDMFSWFTGNRHKSNAEGKVQDAIDAYL